MRMTTRGALIVLLLLPLAATTRAQSGGFEYPYEYTFGFDAKASPRHRDQGQPTEKASSSLRIDMTSWFWFKVGNDDFVWKRKADGGTTNGVGNTRLTFNADAVTEDDTGVSARPSLSFTYTVKLPTGSTSKGLGSGRVDHEVIVEVAKSFGDAAIVGGKVRRRTNIAVDLGGYFAGNPGTSGFTNVGELTIGLTHVLDSLVEKKYKYYGELDLSTHAKDTLSEIYALNELRIKLSDKFRFRVGVRTGITPNSPRFGVYGSITYSGSLRPAPKP
jgi:hypothetical protein